MAYFWLLEANESCEAKIGNKKEKKTNSWIKHNVTNWKCLKTFKK